MRSRVKNGALTAVPESIAAARGRIALLFEEVRKIDGQLAEPLVRGVGTNGRDGARWRVRARAAQVLFRDEARLLQAWIDGEAARLAAEGAALLREAREVLTLLEFDDALPPKGAALLDRIGAFIDSQ